MRDPDDWIDMTQPSPSDPVEFIPGDNPGASPKDGLALCLSGGGYRAMLFHVGVLWRLYEAGWLGRLTRISSVSGGSITAGVLAQRWVRLQSGPPGSRKLFEDLVANPLLHLSEQTIDVRSGLLGLLTPRKSIAQYVADGYRKHLFGRSTLQDLPDAPIFVLNATNLASGALLRFTKAYLADWRVGRVNAPTIDLAVAVACSSAFPPFLSPYKLRIKNAKWIRLTGSDLAMPEFQRELVLSDGGVYDNLGIETAWKSNGTILVSDAGGHMGPEAEPPADWPRHMLRVLKVIDNQVRSLRKRQVIAGFRAGTRKGMYVGIRSDPADFHLASTLPTDLAVTGKLADQPTRLAKTNPIVARQLINWGYAIADTGLRKHLDPAQSIGTLPYPQAPLSQ